MPNIPEDLHYSKDHEWIRVEDDEGVIGITEYAQEKLGDVVYVELPRVGEQIEAGKTFGTVESVKAASDLFAPVSGEVTEAHDSLLEGDEPKKVNDDPYGEGWMIRVRLGDKAEVDSLLSAAEYRDFLGTLKDKDTDSET